MKVEQQAWGTYQGNACQLFTISDPSSGFLVSITDLGATVLRVVVGGGDITITQDSPELLISRGGYLGAACGRVANRVANGTFSLDGKEYHLFCNGKHSLHGGQVGFDKKVWNLVSCKESVDEVVLTFHYTSVDGEEGYPGELSTQLSYHISPMKLEWEFEATTNKTTVVNLTNHCYWNLDGLDVSIDDQEIQLASDEYMAVDENCLAQPDPLPVDGSIDMRKPRKFADIFGTFGDVDNNFFLATGSSWSESNPKLNFAACIRSAKTGRSMTIHTTEPCIQLYTGNFLHLTQECNGNHKCGKHFAFCLETQRPPNAINTARYHDFVTLKPGQVYRHRTVHQFQ